MIRSEIIALDYTEPGLDWTGLAAEIQRAINDAVAARTEADEGYMRTMERRIERIRAETIDETIEAALAVVYPSQGFGLDDTRKAIRAEVEARVKE